MLNCKQASQLASRAMDESLPIWTRLSLKLHLLICRNCRIFTRQLKFLREATHHFILGREYELSTEAKQRITNKLKAIDQQYPPN